MTEYTLYTKDHCSHCLHAKNLLKTKGFTYKEFKVPTDIDKNRLQQKVSEAITGVVVRSVPQVFHGEVYVGGFKELQKYLNQ